MTAVKGLALSACKLSVLRVLSTHSMQAKHAKRTQRKMTDLSMQAKRAKRTQHKMANLSMQAKTQVFASRGSMGIWLSRRPRGVKASPASSAPRDVRERTAETIAVASGGVSIWLSTSTSLWSGPNLVLTVRQSCCKGVRQTSGACCSCTPPQHVCTPSTLLPPWLGPVAPPLPVFSC